MPISSYLRKIRMKVGTDLLLMPSVTAIVWSGNKELLLLRHSSSPIWTFPGGLVDPGEYPAEALVREVREETGILIRVNRILGVFGGPEGFRKIYSNGDQVEFVDIAFECTSIGGVLDCQDGEAVEAKFFNVAKLDALSIDYPVTIGALSQASTSPLFYWKETWVEN